MNNSTLTVVYSPVTTTLSSIDDQSRPWFIYVEIALLATIGAFSLVGNSLVLRNATSDMTRSARQNVVLFISLALGDLAVSVLRGAILIYILVEPHGDQQHTVCVILMVSTTFVALILLTNTVLALQRLYIVLSYSKYKKIFTLRRTLVTMITTWILLPTLTFVIYQIFRGNSFFKVDHYSCVLMSDNDNFASGTSGSFTLARIALVCIFGIIPMCVTSFCYCRIHKLMKKTGIRKTDRNIRNANFSRVTVLSICRVALMAVLHTPFCLMIVLVPIYQDTLLPVVRYCDYLLILYSAISPILTLNDADLTEYKSRRAWISARFAGGALGLTLHNANVNKDDNVYSVNITSGDLKCFKNTDQ